MRRKSHITSSHHRGGYVLLMTLLLLMLVATALTAACRTSLTEAIGAEEAERSLQYRWATMSCQQTLLPNCESVLAFASQRNKQPVVSMRRSVTLCGQAIQLIFSDESAKVNVHSVLAQSGKSDAQIQLRELLSGSGIAGRVHLRPASFPSLSGSQGPARVELGSYGEVFEDIQPSELLTPRYGIVPAMDLLTCWGGGRVNWRRGSEKTLRQRLSPPLSFAQVQRLITAASTFNGSVPLSLASALDTCGLNSQQRTVANDRLTENSSCHSLWVLTAEKDLNRYHLYISDSSQLPPQLTGFEW